MTSIGQRLIRYSDDTATRAAHPVGLAHLCESEIEDRKVMACGPQMHRRRVSGSLRIASRTDPRCQVCPPWPDAEDDSTYGQVAPI